MLNPDDPNPTPGALDPEREAWLKQFIRAIPDYPEPGILFRDITPLLQNPEALRYVIEAMATRYRDMNIDQVVRILENKPYEKHVGPALYVIDSKNVNDFDKASSLAPDDFQPTFNVE